MYKTDDNITIFNVFKKLEPFASSKKLFAGLLFIILLAVIFAVISLIYLEKTSSNKILVARQGALNNQIVAFENKNKILELEIILLKKELYSLLREKEQRKINKIAPLLGIEKVKGEGLTIMLADSDQTYEDNTSSQYIVHDIDLLKIVNFLWANGAEAISINNERIVNSSRISCIGSTVLVNQKPLVPPFTNKAAGKALNPEGIKNDALMLSFSIRGLKVKVSDKQPVEIAPGT
ncbi:MAG: DUF881 domain-containing protein [Candidatus Gastranaerophilales bacterium]|nr:DUF881 domain-containing protein [Candidatus Gastranaerophilales bacterium]